MKKAIVIAVAGALIAPAVYADTVNVNVYGKLRLGVENINGATNTLTNSSVRVVDNTSVLGFKGSEDLGNDWLAQFQVEGGLKADGDTAASLNTRNTFVAIKQANIGTLLVGQYDTPYKVARGYLAKTPVEDSTAEVSTLWGHDKSGNAFYTRQNSSIQYQSPTWAGFDFRVGYGPDEAKTATTNKQRWSFAGFYDGAHAFASIAHETRADATAKNDAASANAITGGAKIGTGDIAVGWEHFSTNGAINQHNLYLATNWKIADSWNVGGHYGYASSSDTGKADGAHVVSLGVRYDLSKRTDVTTYYSHISNEKNGQYNFNVNPEGGANVVAGKGPSVFGFGINHKF